MKFFNFNTKQNLRKMLLSQVNAIPQTVNEYIVGAKVGETSNAFKAYHYYSPTMMFSNIHFSRYKTLQIFYGSDYYFKSDKSSPFIVEVRVVDDDAIMVEENVERFTINNEDSINNFTDTMVELIKSNM